MRTFFSSTILIFAYVGVAFAQTPASSLITVLPKSDGSATGCLNFRELAANGLNYGCLKAPSDIYANRTVTLPNHAGMMTGRRVFFSSNTSSMA